MSDAVAGSGKPSKAEALAAAKERMAKFKAKVGWALQCRESPVNVCVVGAG
jgi:hypothetical protein